MWTESTLLVLLAGLVLQTSADLFSCGGFVRSAVPLDYSKIKLKLYTAAGHLKDETECQANGYWMLPVYNRGAYTIRIVAPDGWNFEPDSVALNIDGTTDACSTNEDISFSLKSFTISGRVQGAPGQRVQLQLVDKNDRRIAQSESSPENGGEFHFTVEPNEYFVRVDPTAGMCLSGREQRVDARNGPVNLKEDFKINGYDVQFFVKTSKGQPVEGVELAVFGDQNVQGASCTPVSAKIDGIPGNPQFQCTTANTDSAGATRLSCAPAGTYHVRPIPSANNYEVEPELQKVVVKQKTEASFKVTGFSGRGRVLAADGKSGLSDVSIIRDGKELSDVKTDADGYYTLRSLQEGQEIRITAKRVHFSFETVTTKLSLPPGELPSIRVKTVEVCGTATDAVGVEFRAETGESAKADENGKFCLQLTPGKHTISPSDNSLTPTSLPVDTTRGPQLKISFSRFKTDVRVRVNCPREKTGCDSLRLELMLGQRVLATADRLETEKGVFLFRDIVPDIYSVRVRTPGAAFCWQAPTSTTDRQELRVDRDHIPELTFTPSGYLVNVRLSHPAEKLSWKRVEEGAKVESLQHLTSGVTRLCLEQTGSYKVQATGCHGFGEHQVSVPTASELALDASDAEVGGKLELQPGTRGDEIRIGIRHSSGGAEKTITATPDGRFVWREPLANKGQTLVLTPQSSDFLFEPPTVRIQFNGECGLSLAKFTADRGLYIDGVVKPAVEGAEVTAIHKTDAANQPTLKGVTKRDGSYSVGPVRRPGDWKVSLEKEGWALTESTSGQWTSQRLSQLSVKIEELAAEHEAEPLIGALLSLTGPAQYRSNTRLDNVTAKSFVGLAPGEYYVRPILQEFRFEPATQKVQVREGEHAEVVLKAERTAWSAFGKLSGWTGSKQNSGSSSAAPAQGAWVEALADEKCDRHFEETQTNVDGDFRIRGLKPDCQYEVRLRAGRLALPASYMVQTKRTHVRRLTFVEVPTEEHYELLGKVDTDILPSAVTHYKISLIKNGDTLQQVTNPIRQSVFQFGKLQANQEYVVRVEPDRPASVQFPVEEATFTASTPTSTIELTPRKSAAPQIDVEIGKSGLLLPPILALLALALANQQKTIEILSAIREKIEQILARRDQNQGGQGSPTSGRRYNAKKSN